MKSLILCLLFSTMGTIGSVSAETTPIPDHRIRKVMIPDADKFVPFVMQIRAGDTVQWTNNDTDDHTVVSDDAYTSPGFGKMNKLIPGTDHNGGHPGVISKTFNHSGTFVYYCRFHSKLDKDNQPIAPGPFGGIQDEKGNFGTPMMGVITV
ncbi:MAG: cupredoxin domain-containing protein, partial [Bacteriovorax sp.]